MTRKVYPRSWERLTDSAADVLRRYEAATGWTPSLPVPIEDIVERVFDLRILWEPIQENAGDIVLAMLVPEHRTIVVNETHADGILEAAGPLNFTFAHELGHWLFDAENPDQGRLFDDAGEPVFCRSSSVADETDRIREGNANRFAASLLMPRALLPIDELRQMPYHELREEAARFGVSTQALQIRIDQLSGREDLSPKLG